MQGSAASATHQPGFELGAEGFNIDDAEMHVLSVPPVLLVAAYRFMKRSKYSLMWVPLLKQLTDEWQQRELTDVSILVARLMLMRDTLQKPSILLSDLLGGVDVGKHQMSFYVPESHFSVCDIKSRQELSSAELKNMVSNMDTQWAFRDPSNPGLGSWLLLQRNGTLVGVSEACRVVLLRIASDNNTMQESIQPGKLVNEAERMLQISGADRLRVYVTDQYRTWPAQSLARLAAGLAVPLPMVLVDRKYSMEFYSGCVALVKSAVTSIRGAKRARVCL